MKVRNVICLGLLTLLSLQGACQKSYRTVSISRGGVLLESKPRDHWPTEAWQVVEPSAEQWDLKKLNQFVDYAFAKPNRTDGLLVIHDGKIIVERYQQPYSQNSLHYTWSISKSVFATLIGIAEKQGILNRTHMVQRYLDEFKEPSKQTITIDHLLRMESGLGWTETYEYAPLYSTVVKMLYTEGSSDMAKYASRQPMEALPGEYIKYSSGSTNVLSAVLRNALADDKAYESYPWSQLFEPLGITTAVFEMDKAGVFVASSYLHMTARDLAKIGFLYLNDGIWEGDRLLPERWVYTATTDTMQARVVSHRSAYGAQWYMNFALSEDPDDRKFPSVTQNLFWASGHWGQYLMILPEHDIVLVRYGDDRRQRINLDGLLKLLIEAKLS
ncbi:serine hydrolase domain-containing protein [Pseudobacteriovorax antillogorgiicola]|uniref:Beta-lactamase-related domain-containing protein n=1 Tax=Pseudobacteriovorax antillogorgiicola TaxID=1513793 RepID=A0A1Y6BZ96_9BACT|nr:serine hydrolase [Pseudobacteriovorax antillogorgiicola]TCS51214.1 hypothetical protein EDD56_11198 [Pseudobacteriovorax antillogorgiicola]SMF37075.1 hypothetical protein SAMN06296036_11180 [Pseudobacteriovorax antillogorgiicola]